VANPLGIFFSRLAPEDKQFIKKIGISLIVLLVLSALGWYIYVNFAKEQAEKKLAGEQTEFPDLASFDTILVPEIQSSEEQPSDAAQKTEGFASSFDEQAHLQLMRQNANQYNYKVAHSHGARIAGFLLADSKRRAEWGRILLRVGKPHEAVSVLQRIALEDIVETEVAIDMAFAMLRSGNADGAIEFLDEKIKSSNDLDLLAAKAAIIGEHPDVKSRAAAEPIFLKSVRNNSPNANYWYGRFLMKRGDFNKSKTYLERAVKIKPNEPHYIARLGMAEFYLKRDSNAEVLYKKALNINPYDHNTWFNLGELYLSLANESARSQDARQRTHRALESYMRSISIDSLHPMANYRIGLILNGNAQHKEAINHLNIALEKMPEDIPVMQQLSSAYIKIGDTTTSVNYLNTILQLDPFNRIAASELNRIRGL
jgi:tetratricopeptide (TPR) repeat protein